MDQFVGVDWASGCWVVVATDGNNVEITTEPSILNVWDRHKKADSILVDIPIGLPETSPRACDERAKEFLAHRRSSVFSVPCRDAVEIRDYDRARKKNGGSLGSQSWGLIPRIREVDTFFSIHSEAEDSIYESHPEVCYAQFAEQEGIESIGSKQNPDGIDDRIEILEMVNEEFGGEVRAFINERQDGVAWHQRIQSGRIDDVLDAAVLALTATEADGTFAVFPEERDANDRRVIVYPLV
jgi:predicted RNase H-like nuclease